MATEGRTEQTQPDGPKGMILLFEDDETLADLLARVLRSDGYKVDLFENAGEIPSTARLAHYDLVLSDIHLAEGSSGHDVLRKVRSAGSSLPVILMTAFADVEGAMNAVTEGAYEYIPKPIKSADLFAAVARLGSATAAARAAAS